MTSPGSLQTLDVLVSGAIEGPPLVTPPLTTAQQPCREIALTAFRAMIDRLADATLPACQLTVAPRLVIRDSCGAYLK